MIHQKLNYKFGKYEFWKLFGPKVQLTNKCHAFFGKKYEKQLENELKTHGLLSKNLSKLLSKSSILLSKCRKISRVLSKLSNLTNVT